MDKPTLRACSTLCATIPVLGWIGYAVWHLIPWLWRWSPVVALTFISLLLALIFHVAGQEEPEPGEPINYAN